MKIGWMRRGEGERVILFFNGWGMDASAVEHLETDADVLVAEDYRDVRSGTFPELSGYRECDVVAWSMGVWAAGLRLGDLGVVPTRCTALAGTSLPVDDRWGIPARIYRLTERGMDARGREKFVDRMFASREEASRFRTGNRQERPLEEVCEELFRIREQLVCPAVCVPWTRVYVPEGDLIFPVRNQLDFWRAKGLEPEVIPGGHYPFFRFRTWEEMLGRPGPLPQEEQQEES